MGRHQHIPANGGVNHQNDKNLTIQRTRLVSKTNELYVLGTKGLRWSLLLLACASLRTNDLDLQENNQLMELIHIKQALLSPPYFCFLMRFPTVSTWTLIINDSTACLNSCAKPIKLEQWMANTLEPDAQYVHADGMSKISSLLANFPIVG